MTPEAKERLSRALKAKWASGTRKKNPPETYAKASATHKAMYASGARKPPGMTPEQARERRAMMDAKTEAKLAAHLRKLSKARRGKENPPGPSAKGPGNWKAKWWEIRAPDRTHYSGMNLSEIVRQNAHLFDPKDVVWHKSKCRATRGLRSLYEKRGDSVKTWSWKGWVAIDGPFKFPPDPRRLL